MSLDSQKMIDLLDSQDIIDILLRQSYVNSKDIEVAKEYAKKNKVAITDYLIAEDLLTPDLLGQAVAEALDLPYTDLNSHSPSKEQVLKVSEKIAKDFRVVLFAEDKDSMTFTSDNPKKEGLAEALKGAFPNKKIKLTYSLPEDIDENFRSYRKSLDTRFAKIIEEDARVAPEIINQLMQDALLYRASDIHFEPEEKEVVVRFRIDGILQEAGRIPKDHYENILNRIKVQSHLKIDEHFAAQDGSMRYKKGEKSFATDIRVSIIPTLNGEKVVMRILGQYVRSLNLGSLGLSEDHQEQLSKSAHKPFGMILVAGSTGSGKTTTLYALLKTISRPEVNVTTIEDPVEYKISGISQIQVNPRTNLTFAKGLRSIVRQDPDIILVGEIRDEETAEIAVNAALTGHLLLSTFHANDAATTIPRLLDMGIEPFLLASTLELVIAQRLVRRICESCRYSVDAKKEVFEKIPANVRDSIAKEIPTIYRGKGCDKCGHTGYNGRIAIYEFVAVTREMEDLILTNPSRQQIWDLARKQGTKSLFEDGLKKVNAGITTLDELLRLAEPPEK